MKESNIKVAIRIRPILAQESMKGYTHNPQLLSALDQKTIRISTDKQI
jgi:hypothetical protein